MKKSWVALLAGLIALGACKPTPQSPAVGVAFGSFDSPDVRRIRSALTATANFHSAFSLFDAGNQQTLQNSQIDELLSQHVKALAVNLVLSEAAGLVIDKAKDAIVPLVLFGEEPSASDMTKWDRVYYVGARRDQAGRVQGQILAEWWKMNPAADRNRDRMVQYAVVGGDAQAAADLEQAFEGSLKELRIDAVLVASSSGEGRAAGFDGMRGLLRAHGAQIEAVVCRGDAEALGAIDALRARGYFAGKKYMPVLGVGATPPALDSIAAGELLGTAWSDAEGQAKAIYDLTRALASGTAPSRTGWPLTDGKYVWVPYRMVTARNYAEFGK